MPLPTDAGTSTVTGNNQTGANNGPSGNRRLGAPRPAPSYGTTSSTPAPSTSGGAPAPAAPSKPSVSPALVQELLSAVQSAIPGYTDLEGKPGFDMTAVATAEQNLDQARRNESVSSLSSYTTGQQGSLSGYSPYPAASSNTSGGEKSEDKVAAAEEILSEALRAQREQAIGNNRRGPGGSGPPAPPKVDPMTQAEYDALSPKERAAVDFNTMLVQAVRRDTRLGERYEKTASKDDRLVYDRSVEKMFGDDGGSNSYAPETLGLLKQIGFKDESADLDDFLGLRAAITAKDMRRLKTVEGPTIFEAQANPVQLDRYQLTETLATQTQQMQETLARGNELLATMQQTMQADRMQAVELLGGIGRAPKEGLGWAEPKYAPDGSPADLNTYFQDTYEKLAQAKGKDFQARLAALQSDVDSGILRPAEYDALLSYMDQRSGNAERYGAELGSVEEARYQNPEKFRANLGLGGGDNAGR